MYLGKIMELTSSDELYAHPLHPYTQALISAAPIPDPEADLARERILLEGEVPSPINPPLGCNFCTRCRYADERCRDVYKRQAHLFITFFARHVKLETNKIPFFTGAT